MLNNEKELGVLVLSCDAYSDIWPIFFEQYNKHWSTSNFNLYLACNDKSSGITGVIDAKSGPDIDWSSSLIKSIGKITEKYILIMIEDAFLYKDVDHKHFLYLLDEFVSRDMDYFRLKNTPKPDVFLTKELGKISSGQLYRTALFPSIWKKEVLVDIIKVGESAWEFELKGSYRSDKYNKFYSVYNNVFHVIHGVIKGKWHPNAIANLEKEGVSFTISRPILSSNEVFLIKLGLIRKYMLRFFPSSMRRKIRRYIYIYVYRKKWFS